MFKKMMLIVLLSLVSNVCLANSNEYSKLVCKGKKHPVCHVVKVKKISTDIQFLDMSEIEGKTTDEYPSIVVKK